MSQIILVEDNVAFHELLTLNLSTYIGAQVIPRKDAAEVSALLSILPDVDIVICKSKIGSEPTSQIVLEYLRESLQEVALIIVGDAPPHQKGELVHIQDQQDWESIVKVCAKILGVTPESIEKKPKPEYVPVNLQNFYLIDRTPCEIFIKIKKSADDHQFVKRFHGGDTFNKQVIKKYEDQGLKHFHVHRDFIKNFANFVSDFLVLKLDQTPIESDEIIESMGDSFDYVSREIIKFGFTSATLQLTESVIGKMVQTVEASPEMSSLLKRIINSKTSYLYQHAHMSSVVAAECLKELGIGKKDAYNKLAYAAFFQNISLVDHEEYAKISSYEELEAANLSEGDWDMVFNHAIEAAILISRNPDAPIGVDEIIKSHHGAPNGKGYTKTNLDSLPGLTRIFVLAADFAKHFLEYRDKNKDGKELVPVIKVLFEKYPTEEALKILKIIEKTLKKKPI
ncbi:MAG: hypothetical protein COW01_04555 [Bdellovibrionales bacterium CG12_big_fil_rev_8_21_14_0_65_38_15]|nr:MAG: hypothetical protein COW79_11875 [Bdellovibrionales bacterium CG22_combo_CG10-13_8_21_14_all_38_13]PIQ56329.1 MAG: hypothetical protein COW01_04555 [Bdellovibrionales bacterium CG12_big_fil_rev_8_21_14_0_65_38_15]PIR29360.1 MAG: hypothetical protein COV38_11490 [Bdellovibrionales bacterium CG11_big_fil_rev_8_21_14_0_20_38_13]